MRAVILEKAKAFPVPGPSMESLSKLAVNSHPEFDEIENVVRSDPALAAQILRAANSAGNQGTNKITSIGTALVRLGQRQVLKWALAMMSEGLSNPLVGYGCPAGVRYQALLRANAAQFLAEASGIGEPGACYCAGLFADIGKFILDDLVGEPLRDGERFVDRERATFGIDHAEAGSVIARSWGMPEPLVDLIRFHHDPSLAVATDNARVVCAADALASALSPDGIDGFANQPVLQSIDLGLSEDAIDRVVMKCMLEAQAFQETQS